MEINKAIEILTLDKKCEYEGPSHDLEDALQLGIEALKYVKAARGMGSHYAPTQLIGETHAENKQWMRDATTDTKCPIKLKRIFCPNCYFIRNGECKHEELINSQPCKKVRSAGINREAGLLYQGNRARGADPPVIPTKRR